MPQASDATRALMEKWFHDPISDEGPTKFLLSHGWHDANGMWFKPTSAYTPSIYEIACLMFLRDEWDHNWHEPLFSQREILSNV